MYEQSHVIFEPHTLAESKVRQAFTQLIGNEVGVFVIVLLLVNEAFPVGVAKVAVGDTAIVPDNDDVKH